MIKFILPLLLCVSMQAQVVFKGGSLGGATLGTTNYVAPSGDITTGLTARWKFDESSGTSAADDTGNGHTATVNGTATFTTSSKIGSHAIAYDGGAGGGCSFTGIASSSTFTLTAWVFATDVSSYKNIMTQTSQRGVWIHNGKIDFFITSDLESTTTITTGVWHHIGVVCNAGNITFYLDGKPDGTATGGASCDFDSMGSDSGAGPEQFIGNVDDVRLFVGRALSDADMAALYNFPGP